MANDIFLERAKDDFDRARKRVALHRIAGVLGRRAPELLSFEPLRQRFQAEADTLEEVQEIPLDAIVGSVGRYRDFDRDFLPTSDHDRDRWARVKVSMEQGRGLVPIDVYQIGEVYFVIDGNHRVSIARLRGDATIFARVTRISSRVALSPQDTLEEVVLKAEQNAFLEATDLDRTHPDLPLIVTEPGSYPLLLQQIELVHFQVSQQRGEEPSLSEAASLWVEEFYLPVLEPIRAQNLLRFYPRRTETDLFLWMVENHQAVRAELGQAVSFDNLAIGLAEQRPESSFQEKVRRTVSPEPQTGAWRERRQAAARGRLFSDILVLLEGWDAAGGALEEAIPIAQREEAHLLGLTITPDQDDSAQLADLRGLFDARCQAAGVSGQLVVGRGDRPAILAARGRWSDLLVLPAPGSENPDRAADMQAVLRQALTPVWIARQGNDCRRALLAYDGSPRAHEALFLAAYLSVLWGLDLSVVTVHEKGMPKDALQDALTYLASYQMEVRSLQAAPPAADAILRAAEDEQADLILLGSSQSHLFGRRSGGHLLDRLVREARQSLLICR